jgi:quercetin dioxygenase-like cupin family protein
LEAIMSTVMSRPFSRAAGGERTRNYMGARFTFLADAADTGGGYSLMEVAAWPGGEPPPHIHTGEDEAFYVLDGTWTFRCGGTTTEAGPGTLMFMPRGLVHGFTAHDESCRALVIMSPAGLESAFMELSDAMPADMTRPPRAVGPPSPAHLERIGRHGVSFSPGAGSSGPTPASPHT